MHFQRLIWLALPVAFAQPCLAQALPERDSTQSRKDRFAEPVIISVIAGRGMSSPTVFVQGSRVVHEARKRPSVYELEISKTVSRSSGKKLFFEYFVAAQPAVAISGNLRFTVRPQSCSFLGCTPLRIEEQRYNSYGFGVTPLGGRIMRALPGNVKAGLELSAGAIYLTKAVPSNDATHFNFHLVVRPTVGVPLGKTVRVWSAYEFAHVSNGNTGKINPGINAGLFTIGLQAVGGATKGN